VLAGQLTAARRIVGALRARPPTGPLDDPLLGEEVERIRWFALPADGLDRVGTPCSTALAR